MPMATRGMEVAALSAVHNPATAGTEKAARMIASQNRNALMPALRESSPSERSRPALYPIRSCWECLCWWCWGLPRLGVVADGRVV